jgi:chromosome partitioning related protein ParA
MAKKFGVVSTKGGVGKTSVCANLGGILADMGQRVLLIDGDFQQTLSSYYRIEYRAPYGLSKLVTQADPIDCISRTQINHLDIVLSDDPHGKLTEWFRESAHHVYYLAAVLKQLDDDYDYVLIDSQGARGIMQQSIILASDVLLSPIVPDALESREFTRGTVDMLQSLEPPPSIAVPMTKVPPLYGIIYRQDRTNNSIELATGIRKRFYNESSGMINILNTRVPYMSAYKKAAGVNLPVHQVEVKRVGPTPSAYETFLALARELLPHLSDTVPQWHNAPVSVKSNDGGG